MEAMQCPENTCFFTGHRILPKDGEEPLRRNTAAQIYSHIRKGYRYFVCGGAIGYDTLAAEEVLRIRNMGMKIALSLALPCRDQTARWKDISQIQRYREILAHADTVHYVNDFYHDGCMKERNQYMVEQSTACIAYCKFTPRSGTAQTVRMAEEMGLTIAVVGVEEAALPSPA